MLSGSYKKLCISHITHPWVCGLWMTSRTWSVWEVINEGICMPAFFSAFVSVYLCMSAQTHTHTRRSTMSFWPLQSNSSTQKSLKQPLVFWASWDPPSVSSALNSHQPLLLPKITQERHSSLRLTTVQLGRKRGIKTHTKKETHHIVEGGKREHSYGPMLADINWWFWKPKNRTH